MSSLHRTFVFPWVLILCASFHVVSAKDQLQVGRPPKSLDVPAYFQKYISANGYPIISTSRVNDYALKEAAFLVNAMLGERPDIRDAMIANGSRLVVMAHDEFTTDNPFHARLKPKDYWDKRARGLGGSADDPICSCAEENLLAFEGDPYHSENILIHEFAHNIHLVGLNKVDPTFDVRLKAAFEKAMQQGLWKTKYASVNRAEYWAEGVQSWFSNNREPDHDHNHVNTRAELVDYDPGLAKLCEEVFGATKLVYTKPTTRLRGHMKGYNPKAAPRFAWPSRLKAASKAIQAEIEERTSTSE